MATQPSEEQGNSNHVEPAADIENVLASVGSSSSQSGGASDIENVLASVGSASSQSGGASDIENVLASVGSASSQSGGASENSENEVDEPHYRPLLRAAFWGDWESATRFFEQDAASKMAKITSRSETLLHIAALSAHDQFLENLVELLSPNPEALEVVDCDGRTALHNAVLCGSIRMVKALVRSNPKLTQLADKEGRVPLGISAQEASTHKEIAWFLATSTTDEGANQPFSSPSAIDTMIELTYASHHDITLYLAGRYPHLLTKKSTKYKGISILMALAVMKSDFPSGTNLSVLEALIYKCIPVNLSYKPTNKNSDPELRCPLRSLWNAAKSVVPIIKRVHEVKLRNMAAIELAKQVCMAISYMNITEIIEFFRAGDKDDLLFQATVHGISEIVKLCIQFFPQLIHFRPGGQSLPTHAVIFRQAMTLRLFLKLSSTTELSLVLRPSVNDFKAMMRAVASYSPRFDTVTTVGGAAFVMQRELQWCKTVESCVMSHLVKVKWFKRHPNDIAITHWNAFVDNHKELLEKGEKWVKDTANSCMLVSTLIATILFATAFTVPGGKDNNTGIPLLLGQDSLLVFAISDALGLFSSVTAILLFLAILTSRYEAQDFLYSLPKKILMGLCFLFLSLAFMLVTFAATLTMVLDKRLEWVLTPIILLASIPMALFAILQLPLLFHMVKSTYGSSIFRPEGIWDGVNYTKQDQ